MINKIIKIDGAPGITLENEKGNTGKNGGMIFFTQISNSSTGDDYFSIFDMWSNEGINDMPIYINKHNYCEYVIPDKDDYIVIYSQNMVYIYIVKMLIKQNDLYNRDDLNKYIQNGLPAEYADNIYNYYNIHHAEKDCCLVKRISVLNTAFTEMSDTNLSNINVSVSLDNILYTGYTGDIQNNYPVMAEKSLPYITFNISAESKSALSNLKIEAEFFKNEINGEMCSILPTLWKNPNDINLLNKNYYIGYLENYNYKNNFDEENLSNFTIIVKDYNQNSDNNVYISTIKIPEIAVYNYSVCLYAYYITNSGIDKIFIGNFLISDLLNNLS